MGIILQIKRNTADNVANYVGHVGELVLATDTMQLFVMDGQTAGGKLVGMLTDYAPERFMVADVNAGHVHLKIKAGTILKITDSMYYSVGTEYDFVATAKLDTGAGFQAGKDYYVYLATADNAVAQIVVSLDKNAPAGFTTFRKIGGFHTLCAAAGAISGHPLNGYAAGEILPESVWCLNHRPSSNPEGMVYEKITDCWVDIYNMSTTGESKYGAARANNMHHYQFTELARAWGKSLLGDEEFFNASKGSNQKTAVAGAAQPNPDTTGGRKDTAGRRMISYIGCEEMCGLQWQHLREVFFSGGNAWAGQNGDEGDYYATNMLLAGGAWDSSSHCGSRCRIAIFSLSSAYASNGARGRSRAMHTFA